MTSATSISIDPVEHQLANKDLISEELWGRLVARIVTDEAMDHCLAERIMDQTLGFLRLIAVDPSTSHSPSSMVDIGWHTFILYTREYAAFCEKVAGFFIHHAPSDVPGVDYGTGRAADTLKALRRRGIVVDEELWADAKWDHCGGTGGDGKPHCVGCNDDCGGGGNIAPKG